MSRQLLKAWNVLSLDQHIHIDGASGDNLAHGLKSWRERAKSKVDKNSGIAR